MSIHDVNLPSKLGEKFERLKMELNGYGSMAVAFSGGVDSAFLLAAAKAAGGGRLLAVTVVSSFFTDRELARAGRTAERLGVEHLCLEMNVWARPEVVRNGGRRCYHCKHHSFSLVKEAAVGVGIHTLVHGINVDDLGDYRPGIEAAEALGFQAPLVAAGFSKAEIRECAKSMGLEAWDLPSQSCLATRIPVGEKITPQALGRVARAEALLHDMGLGQVRVRCHRDLARIEVMQQDFEMILKPEVRQKIHRALTGLGFSFVSLDMGGYETGKMNTEAI